jgi:hypothetical protein
MAMFGLPVELLGVIEEYWPTRADWRTCKRHEAEIVQENNELVDYYLYESKDRWCWSPEETLEVYDWSLYGKKWLMHAHEWMCIAQRRPPLIPPEEWMHQDPQDWYSHRIQWLNA